MKTTTIKKAPAQVNAVRKHSSKETRRSFGMDWARDDACLSRSKTDLERVFRYAERPALIVKIVASNHVDSASSTKSKIC